MKPVILNDTTFRLWALSLDGLAGSRDVVELCECRLQRRFREQGIFDWLEEYCKNRWQYQTEISDYNEGGDLFYAEMWLRFMRSEDAVAFRLRWM